MELDLARSLFRAVETKAGELGIRVAACLIDAGGNMIAFERMPGTMLASTTLAEGKAYTAVAWQRPSKELWEIAQPGCGGFGINTVDARIVLSDGGVPLLDHGTLAGGIGVSGGTAEQDGECARAAVAVFRRRVET